MNEAPIPDTYSFFVAAYLAIWALSFGLIGWGLVRLGKLERKNSDQNRK